MSRASLWRRFLVLSALAFWLGGFTFYAAVVVPVGQAVLRPSSSQAFVTQIVTHFLNGACVLALAALLWEMIASRNERLRLRWLTWTGILISLAALVWLHSRLDVYLDVETHTIQDRDAMWPIHRLYLGISTFQWLCGVVHAWSLLAAWHKASRGDGN